MKSGLPLDHGLPDELLASALLYRDTDGQILLTDVQFAALEAGVAIGKNIIALAPTSSGKTDVGLFAAAGWLSRGLTNGSKVVFLTSHRALARQKFAELIHKFAPLFTLTLDEFVLATGDDIIDGHGDPVLDAFSGTIIIATYEKYLNLLSGSGLNTDLAKVCFVADEVQLIGDASRGQNVEILLTLLRHRAGQIVGLSAVIEVRYGELLASWLHAEMVRTTRREVDLSYELRTPSSTYITSTATESEPESHGASIQGTLGVLRELLQTDREHEPTAVFCMTKKQVFDLAKAWEDEVKKLGLGSTINNSTMFRESTASSDELIRYLPHSFAYHTADLNEEERVAVETRLDDSDLRVVFATTTLASGLNYSFKTVIIHSWQRWNSSTRGYNAIPRSEFHNMAGRAGRLSKSDSAGRAIFFASTPKEIREASRYLSWWELDDFAPRIDPKGFSLLSLQLLSSKVADDQTELCKFLQSTFSAERELERNAAQPEIWAAAVSRSVSNLYDWGLAV